MGEVEHPHHAEDEGEAAGEHKKQQASDESIKRSEYQNFKHG